MYDQQWLRPACAYAQSDQSLCLSLEYSMTLKLLTKHYFEFLILPGGSMSSSGSTLVKMPHCWKTHVSAHLMILDGQAGRKILQQCKTISLPLDALIKVINKLIISTLDKQRICVNTQLKLSKKQLKWNVCVPKSNSNDRYAITCDVIAYHLVHFVSIRLINKCQSGIDFIFN